MLKVIECDNAKGHYYTIIEETRNTHCHTMKKNDVEKIKKCYSNIERGLPVTEYSYGIRNKAMRLFYKTF